MDRKSTDICVVEANGDSVTDTSIPPFVARICDKLGIYGTARMEFGAVERARIHEYPGAYASMEILDMLDATPTVTYPEPIPTHFFFDLSDDKAKMYEILRRARKHEAESFRGQYIYGPDKSEKRYCVWIDDGCYWQEKSSGITWVGVHGADSVCVVTWRGYLDTMRLRGNRKLLSDLSFERKTVDLALSLFRKSIICEIEDLGDPSSELRQKFQKCIKKPFGVVSANPGTNNIEASDYDEENAIQFLKEKMKSVIDFDAYETTKAAIHGFQHLFRKKVKADEIEVSILDPGSFFSNTEKESESGIEVLSVDEIEKLLDDSIGEMEIINPIHKFPKKQKTSWLTYLSSPGGSSSISET